MKNLFPVLSVCLLACQAPIAGFDSDTESVEQLEAALLDTDQVFANEVVANSVHAPQAEGPGDAGEYLSIHGGRCDVEDMGVVTWHNIVARMGLASTNTNGESAQINFMYGDNRTGKNEFIAGEIGFVGTVGDGWRYDPDENGYEQTPYLFRIHSGKNEERGKPVNFLIHSNGFLNLSAETFVQQELNSRESYSATAWRAMAPSAQDAGDGQGGLKITFNRAVTTKINETRRIYMDNAVPYGRHGMAECRLHSKIPGDIRETYRFKFDWLGGGASSAAYVENLADMNQTDRSIVGRVTVGDLGIGGYVGINVVGVNAGSMNWILFCDLFVEP